MGVGGAVRSVGRGKSRIVSYILSSPCSSSMLPEVPVSAQRREQTLFIHTTHMYVRNDVTFDPIHQVPCGRNVFMHICMACKGDINRHSNTIYSHTMNPIHHILCGGNIFALKGMCFCFCTRRYLQG